MVISAKQSETALEWHSSSVSWCVLEVVVVVVVVVVVIQVILEAKLGSTVEIHQARLASAISLLWSSGVLRCSAVRAII